MKILAIIFCIATLNLCAYENDSQIQENEFNRMLMMKCVPPSEITDFSLDSPMKECAPKTSEVSSESILSEQSTKSTAMIKSVFYNTYTVSIVQTQGFLFHTADYYDGTRIVTCLNGGLVGLQGVFFNGVKVNESANVNSYANYFVHYYPGGTVKSYSNQQVVELY